MTLHVFTDDADTVIATDIIDASIVWSEQMGGEPEDHEVEWDQIPPDQEITIWCDSDGEPGDPGECGTEQLTKTAAQWAIDRGRGFLCTTEI